MTGLAWTVTRLDWTATATWAPPVLPLSIEIYMPIYTKTPFKAAHAAEHPPITLKSLKPQKIFLAGNPNLMLIPPRQQPTPGLSNE